MGRKDRRYNLLFNFIRRNDSGKIEKKVRMMAKKKKTNWKKKALIEWSRIIREVGICEICGRLGERGKSQGWTNLDAHHLINKGASSEHCTSLSNGISLCKHCHQWSLELSPHQNRSGFEQWLRINRPGQWEWYEENYPLDGEKKIGNEIIKCRTVKKTPGLKMNWHQEYDRLKVIEVGV